MSPKAHKQKLTVSIRALRPNPFRDFARCPILKDKVALLAESIRDTGFWPTFVGRREGGRGARLADERIPARQ